MKHDRYVIKLADVNLYLHKGSNQFTYRLMQSRLYKTKEKANEWIKDKREANLFEKVNFEIVEVIAEIEARQMYSDVLISVELKGE